MKTKKKTIKKKMEVPVQFVKVIGDFIADLRRTFPEYSAIIEMYWKAETRYEYLYNHCKSYFPDHIEDIINQNEEMFSPKGKTEFLPGICFAFLWNCEITITTKASIWQYLQLILFAILQSNKDLLENLPRELRTRCDQLLEQMEKEDEEKEIPTEPKLPANMEEGFEFLFESKLGKLAKEIAEESQHEFEFSETADPSEMLSSIMSNPAKFMGFVQNIGEKLKTKIDSGEIPQDEILPQAEGLMSTMQNIPGMPNIGDLMGQLKHMMQQPPPAKENKMVTRPAMKKKAKKPIPTPTSAALSSSNIIDSILNDEELYALFETRKKK